MSALMLELEPLAKTLSIFVNLPPQNSQPRGTPESLGEVTAASSTVQEWSSTGPSTKSSTILSTPSNSWTRIDALNLQAQDQTRKRLFLHRYAAQVQGFALISFIYDEKLICHLTPLPPCTMIALHLTRLPQTAE